MENNKKKYVYPPEKVHDYYISYKERNKDRITEKHKCMFCGGSYSLQTKSKHNTTKKHINAEKLFTEEEKKLLLNYNENIKNIGLKNQALKKIEEIKQFLNKSL